MAERFKAPVLKTGVGASSPWVRIPLPPPEFLSKHLFSMRYSALIRLFPHFFPHVSLTAAALRSKCRSRASTASLSDFSESDMVRASKNWRVEPCLQPKLLSLSRPHPPCRSVVDSVVAGGALGSFRQWLVVHLGRWWLGVPVVVDRSGWCCGLARQRAICSPQAACNSESLDPFNVMPGNKADNVHKFPFSLWTVGPGMSRSI
jgi:hypothetical protein